MVNQPPTFIEEKRLRKQGYRLIAGIDEAGRGPLAGPIVAAALILPAGKRPSWINGIRDSKLLTPEKREYFYECMTWDGVSFGVGIIDNLVIDDQGIAVANRMAMRSAVEQLPIRPDFLLIDYLSLPEVALPQKGIVDGDYLCISIAAASIVAKVTRDRLMIKLDSQYPGYGMAHHKGYATPEHLEALQFLGPCPIHRKTFSPMRTPEPIPHLRGTQSP